MSFGASGFEPPYMPAAVVTNGLLMLLAVAPLIGCSTTQITASEIPVSEITSGEQAIPKPSEFTYNISISAPPIQISSGNLHWHKKLPNDSYTLEDIAIEIYNFGNYDISVAQLEITVDDDTRLLTVNRVIAGGERSNLVFQPMMEGYDGGAHRVHVALLDENGGVLYQNNGENMGPLEPVPGTGSWKPVQN
jgi:hypothetical protein